MRWRRDRTRESVRDTNGGIPNMPLGDLVTAAAYAVERRPVELTWMLDRLTQVARHPAGAAELSDALIDKLVQTVRSCWDNGWQPADLAHVVGRERRVAHRQLCSDVVAIDAERYRNHACADRAWMAQVEAVTDDRSGGAADEPWLDRWARRQSGLRQAILLALETLGTLFLLPRQPRLGVPPSEWGQHSQASSPNGRASQTRRPTTSRSADPKIIERVRALLAKAESTEFPEEAETFTAKAQELIARHAIDLAMLDHGDGHDVPNAAASRRILIDDPYGRAKSLLLTVIADANRCSTVWVAGLGISTVFGEANDIDAVELLYTSLLTQATAAMVSAGKRGSHARSRSFRQSFLVAYAERIGERLREATKQAVDEARHLYGDDMLPVLANREAAAEAARDDAFPQLKTNRITMSDYHGYVAGRAAADLARLGPRSEIETGTVG